MDRLVTFEKEGKSLRECVSCDFTEEMVANVVSGEIQTRVNNAFRDRSMRVTVNVDFNIDEEGRSIWEASGGNRYNDNLGQPTQTIPGGPSRTS